jgi:predicted kinase
MNKLKLWCMQGIQASGKSTKAREIVHNNPNTYRVNKDLLREMLYCEAFNQKHEQLIETINNSMVEGLLLAQHSVVVDNMNLNERDVNKYKKLAEVYLAEFQLVSMGTKVDECLRRDSERRDRGERHVGRDVILNTANRYRLVKQEKPIAVFDLDGTLADCNHRRHFVRKPDDAPADWRKNWPAFNREAYKDQPRTVVVGRLLEKMNEGCEIIICSGRGEEYRDIAEEWLDVNQIPYSRLIMRPKNDSRDDTVVKQQMIDNYLDKSKIEVWFDDRPKVIRQVRSNGINVIDVGDGVEF